MSKVKVSVIVPVFNVGEYLSTSLDSILNQTLEDIEIICINDGSTDDSLNILEYYAKKDKRIKIISKENEGQGTARNVGLDNAQGEFISFVDADDFIKKDMLEKLYNKSVNGNLDLVMCKVSSFDNETHVIDDNLWYYSLKCFSGFKKEERFVRTEAEKKIISDFRKNIYLKMKSFFTMFILKLKGFL